ncbi:ImmA/IrrE family metallo-endopeptidase [Saccharopolyspora sp. HNM0986]|uniref:ImmA/IrrE family metallo-endopeptidase n=1 Tax=Saccharopolyspora galaxeae TaxID=2781241 RepID=UPI001909368D|nr:ImmA/IrrE family metallo-endopeptidase [Saccharopolyspora sp. HNM0986]MBK0869276.1 ImmA/IrrE family metallo-endopeptidase [Saccharopolyspora sp. HNM0986]
MLSCRRSRRWAAELVDELALPARFSTEFLLGRVAARKGRRLEVLPLPVSGGVGRPHGLWVQAAEADYIFVEPRTSALHRRHIVLHEIGHILAHERVARGRGREEFRSLVPDLDPEVVQRLLARAHDGTADAAEREAEEIATALGRRIRDAPPRRVPAVGGVLGFRAS